MNISRLSFSSGGSSSFVVDFDVAHAAVILVRRLVIQESPISKLNPTLYQMTSNTHLQNVDDDFIKETDVKDVCHSLEVHG